jgi:1-acyl-sn-glycerol-3-phosphate acyltransferase
VPTAISGSQDVRNWRRLRFPKVTVQFGDPVRFEKVEEPTREQSQAAADLIFERVEKLYYGLQREGRRRTIQAARQAARQAAAGTARTPAAS